MLLKALRNRVDKLSLNTPFVLVVRSTQRTRRRAGGRAKLPVPPRGELAAMVAIMGIRRVAVHYRVGQTTVRRWCRQFGIPCERRTLTAAERELLARMPALALLGTVPEPR